MRSSHFDEDETEEYSRIPVSQIKSRINSQKYNFAETQEFQDLIGEEERT